MPKNWLCNVSMNNRVQANTASLRERRNSHALRKAAGAVSSVEPYDNAASAAIAGIHCGVNASGRLTSRSGGTA
jgi:hypothetical protein